ncbi:Fungalysin metallopeptidase-domain-containing protein [Thamnocephalis sphaerospora]|uniref:Extracellular metalloproteinase n=1 Tax=Thamnocephalis sphaerospora TaxID=78915 RepID=A0A4P9XRV8_9FUNG|nr:Fungalysin metallopeptidase-domain-containing protein [Thamnocephalis sphaerospora]|eukprot:RKP08692.1 Fungalysin metallopeptidase-domain-containing protein [Thamnocephalis sphaerospora]
MLKSQPTRLLPPSNLEEAALDFVRTQLKVKKGDYKVKSVYTTNDTGVTHVHLKQVFRNLEVSNSDITLNVDKNGKVITYGDNFFRGRDASRHSLWAGAASSRFVSPSNAFSTLAQHIGKPLGSSKITEAALNNQNGESAEYALNGVPGALGQVLARQAYVQVNKDTLEAAWEITVDLGDNYFNAHVSADGKRVLSLIDWVSDASYNVIQFEGADPTTTPRTRVIDPAYKPASPYGWHDFGNGTTTKTTIGNNVQAQVPSKIRANDDGEEKVVVEEFRPESDKLDFDFELDLAKEPSEYREAAVSNLFYMNNIMHDLSYAYGFTEAAGNFQENNWDKGGKGGDAVIANAQDWSGYNNANFATPPDGMQPRMRMYIWDATTPMRDGDLVNEIIAHEYGHGISNRLTGGPRNSNCLGWGEAGGMGEGWSDFFGYWLQFKKEDKNDKITKIGPYVTGDKGVRVYPYSTDMSVNPTTYGYRKQPGWTMVHKTGEIWANMLYQMYWNLVDKLGFSEDKYSVDLTKGNTLAMKLVMDGLKLQPCRPSFVDARDAIIQAEQQLTGGKHVCEIWKAFAKRGLGVHAKSSTIKEDFTLPEECGGPAANSPTTPETAPEPTPTSVPQPPVSTQPPTETPAPKEA